jgi:acyl-CoA dehydrogenase
MDFDIDETQRMILDTAQKIGQQFGLDYWRELDAGKEPALEMWQAICKAGLAGVTLPEKYGGAGLGMVELALVVEELCKAGGGVTLAQYFMCTPIFGGIGLSLFGTDQQKDDMLPGMINGDILCSMALTEPDAGSNSLNLKSFARSDEDGWILNGQKIWITGVAMSHKMLVIARTKKTEDAKNRLDGISMFMIDSEREGLTHTHIDKAGTQTIPASMVFFDDVRVHTKELLGTEHQGFKELLDVLNTERIVTTAGLNGTVACALALAVNYGNNRKVFGDRPISSYQALQFPLAEAWCESECAKLMNFKAATLYDNGQPYGNEANCAKIIAARASSKATDRAMQMMGGMGYARESHVERLWRDTRMFVFAPVSEEMALNHIGQHVLGMARSY